MTITAHVLGLQELTAVLPLAGTLTLHEADLLQDGAFDEVVRGAHFVFHTASPFFIKAELDAQRELIDPALKGTQVSSCRLTVSRLWGPLLFPLCRRAREHFEMALVLQCLGIAIAASIGLWCICSNRKLNPWNAARDLLLSKPSLPIEHAAQARLHAQLLRLSPCCVRCWLLLSCRTCWAPW